MTGITEIAGSRITMTRLDERGNPTGEVQDFSALTSVIEFDAEIDFNEVARPVLSQPYYRRPASYTQEVTFFRPEAELMAILLGMSVVDTSLLVDTHIERGTN